MNRETPPGEAEAGASSRWGAFANAAFAVIWTASYGLQCRHRDLRHGHRLVHGEHEPQSDDRFAHPDRHQPAAVSVHHPGRRADRSRRCAAAAARRQCGDPGVLRDVRRGGLGRFRLAGSAARRDLPARRRRRAGRARLGLDRPPCSCRGKISIRRSAANTAGFNISRAVGPAIGGLVIAWLGISRAVLDLCREQCACRGRAAVVAPAPAGRRAVCRRSG